MCLNELKKQESNFFSTVTVDIPVKNVKKVPGQIS